MSEKTKRQHFVPRGYLNEWTVPGKEQINVYDTKIKDKWTNNVQDVASDRYFNDVDISTLLSRQQISKLRENKNAFNFCEEQFVEHYLANEIEDKYCIMLKNIIHTVACCRRKSKKFISRKDKKKLSYFLAIQFMRTREKRYEIFQVCDCLTQALKENNASEGLIESMALSNDELKKTHVQMFMNPNRVEEMAKTFFRLKWRLGINKTKKCFYTSDNPIGTIAHKHSSYLSMSGLTSEGVEVFIPISPDIVLLMFDGRMHKEHSRRDRRSIFLEKESIIDKYNLYTAINAERAVFSKDNDFSLIEWMLIEDPKIFDNKKITLQWDGKTYFPSR